jgi:surface antigen
MRQMRCFALSLVVAAVVASFLGIAGSAGGRTGVATAIASGSTYLCGPDWSDYKCLSGTGYSGQTVWGSWGPGHNCVSYAAYRLQQNGASQPWPSPIGNAVDWKANALSAGYAVDGNAAVGAIAWWGSEVASGSGHIAYVESVSGGAIVVSEDSYITDTSGYDDQRKIKSGTSDWPDGFIHVRDVGSSTPPPPPKPAYAVESERGDFNGDGRSDLVIATPRGTSGLNYQVALSTGAGFQSWALWANTGTNYTIAQSRLLVGDFSGDGKTDLAIVTPRGTSGLNYQVALSTGTSFQSWSLWANTGSNYTIDQTQVGAEDFNNDRRADLVIVTPRGTSGLNYQVALSTGTSFQSWSLWTNTGSNYTISQTRPFGGDFDGDGREDVGIVTARGTSGLNYQVALSTGTSFQSWSLWANTGSNYTIDQSLVVG